MKPNGSWYREVASWMKFPDDESLLIGWRTSKWVTSFEEDLKRWKFDCKLTWTRPINCSLKYCRLERRELEKL